MMAKQNRDDEGRRISRKRRPSEAEQVKKMQMKVAKAKTQKRKLRNQLVTAKNEKRIEAEFSSVPPTSPATSEAQYHGHRIYTLVEHKTYSYRQGRHENLEAAARDANVIAGRAPFMGGEAGVTRAHALLRSNKIVESSSEETEDEDEVVPLKRRTARKATAYAEPPSSSPSRSSPSSSSTIRSPTPPRQRAFTPMSINLRSNGSSPREGAPRKPDYTVISSSTQASSSPYAPKTTSQWVQKAAPASKTKDRTGLKEFQHARGRESRSPSPKDRKLGRFVVEIIVKEKMEKCRKILAKGRNGKGSKAESRKKK